jgi:hypothetical protein
MVEVNNSLAPVCISYFEKLFQEQQFGEVFALAEYYPITPDRLIFQLVALVNLGNLAQAEILLEQAGASNFADFALLARLLAKIDSLTLEELTLRALVSRHLTLAQYCLEARLKLFPNEIDNNINAMLDLAFHALLAKQFKIGEYYLEQVLQLDTKPSRLLEVALVLLRSDSRKYEEVASLLERAYQEAPQHRFDIIDGYWRLVRLAQKYDDGIARKYLVNVIKLSRSLREFLIEGVREDLVAKMDVLFKYEEDLLQAKWYSKSQYQAILSELINEVKVINVLEARQAVGILLDNWQKLPTDQLQTYLALPLRRDLQLTQHEYEIIKAKLTSLPALIRSFLLDLLNRQRIRPSQLSFSSIPLVSEEIKVHELSPLLQEDSIIQEFGEIEKQDENKSPTEIPTEVALYPDLYFPTQCLINEYYDLKIKLTINAPSGLTEVDKLRFIVEAGKTEITLQVHVSAPNFTIPLTDRPLKLFLEGDSEEITFVLQPHSLGLSNINVEFYYQGSRVGYVIVETLIDKHILENRPALVRVMENPRSNLQALREEDTPLNKHTLKVVWRKDKVNLAYSLISPWQDTSQHWSKPLAEIEEDIKQKIQDINKFLAGYKYSQINPNTKDGLDEWESYLFTLQGYCSRLMKILLPNDLANTITAWSTGTYLDISTDEDKIPWELLFDGKEFWGDKFIMVRRPILKAEDLEKNLKDRPEYAHRRTLDYVVNIVGGNLEASYAREAAELFSNFLPENLTGCLEKKPVIVLKRNLEKRKTDVLHYTCHGNLAPPMLQIADSNDEGLNLIPDSVSQLPLQAGCLVFANACNSTVALLTPGQYTSFGWEFYKTGAAVFIGTLGAIPVSYAIDFAKTVYEELFIKNSTISQAVAIAKARAKQSGNLCWLLFVIYGDPDFTIQLPAGIEGNELEKQLKGASD